MVRTSDLEMEAPIKDPSLGEASWLQRIELRGFSHKKMSDKNMMNWCICVSMLALTAS